MLDRHRVDSWRSCSARGLQGIIACAEDGAALRTPLHSTTTAPRAILEMDQRPGCDPTGGADTSGPDGVARSHRDGRPCRTDSRLLGLWPNPSRVLTGDIVQRHGPKAEPTSRDVRVLGTSWTETTASRCKDDARTRVAGVNAAAADRTLEYVSSAHRVGAGPTPCPCSMSAGCQQSRRLRRGLRSPPGATRGRRSSRVT